MLLTTSRLFIRPLSYQELQLYTQTGDVLERALGVNPAHRPISDRVKHVLENLIIPAIAQDPANYLYRTFWTLIQKEEYTMVGDICFKGPPNQVGEVEIGYGTYDQFQKNGYMTEAVQAIAQWALNQPEVKAVIAETDKDNVASHQVLIKSGFINSRSSEDTMYWRIEK